MRIFEFDLVNHVDTKVQVHRFITQDVLELLSNTVHLVTTAHTQNLSKATVEEDPFKNTKVAIAGLTALGARALRASSGNNPSSIRVAAVGASRRDF